MNGMVSDLKELTVQWESQTYFFDNMYVQSGKKHSNKDM